MASFLARVAALIVLALAPPATAQGWPVKPLKVVIPFAPGGAVDSTGRIIGAKLQEILGQPVIIENKPGVGGNLAADAVAKSEPDGYTILQTTIGQAMSPSLYKQLAYDPDKDLIPVTQLVETGLLLVATPKLEAEDLKGLVALARARPGALNYGNTGVGNPLHLAMEMLKRDTGMDIQAVPFRGDAPLNTALIAGDVQVAVVPVATALALIDARQIKALAVTTSKRIARLPDLPTVAEQGVKDFAADSWQGFFLPAGTPPAIVTRLYETTKQALSASEVAARMKSFASEVVASTPAEFAAKYKADSAKYAAIIRQANIPQQ